MKDYQPPGYIYMYVIRCVIINRGSKGSVAKFCKPCDDRNKFCDFLRLSYDCLAIRKTVAEPSYKLLTELLEHFWYRHRMARKADILSSCLEGGSLGSHYIFFIY